MQFSMHLHYECISNLCELFFFSLYFIRFPLQILSNFLAFALFFAIIKCCKVAFLPFKKSSRVKKNKFTLFIFLFALDSEKLK